VKCDHDVVVNKYQRPFGAFESRLNRYEALQGLRGLSLTFSVGLGLQKLGRFNQTINILIGDGESPTFLASGNGRGRRNDLVPRGWYPEAVRFEAKGNPERELEVCEAENKYRVTRPTFFWVVLLQIAMISSFPRALAVKRPVIWRECTKSAGRSSVVVLV
jgi:hypothetical protein